MNPPDLFDFLDYRVYLAAWFQWKKKTSPRFSHRGFVRRVGQKSPSLVVDLIAGRRRLTAAMVSPFAKAMKLRSEEARYLALLVDLERVTEPEKRNAVWEKISARRRFQAAHAIEGDSFHYLSDWAFPAIRELALRPDFRPDAAWIASTLRPQITRVHAQRALDALFDLGMLVANQDGRVEQADGAVVTPREVLGLAVHNYHQGMIDRARAGIADFKSTERHYTGVTVCVSESLIPQIKDEINHFAERILEICDGSELPVERVYQIHLMAFPLSAGMEDKQ